MPKKHTSLKLNRSKLITVLLVVLLAFVFLKNILFIISNTNKFALAQSGEINQIVEVNGFVIRDEHIVIAPDTGILSCNYNDGERIKSGARIASILTGSVDENIQIRLNKITDRIAEYQASNTNMSYFTGNSQKAEAQILATVDSIITANADGDMAKVATYKNQIYALVEKKLATEREKTLRELIAERDALEESISSVRKDIVAPASGIFVSRLDGYEGMFNISGLGSLLSADLESVQKNKPGLVKNAQNGEPICKIINNYEWYYATVMDVKITKNLKEGAAVKICFPSISSQTINATIANINFEDGEKSVVVFSCNENIDTIYLAREVSAEIILDTFQGLKVQSSSIRVLNDITGVYIVKDNKAVFRKVDLLYSDSDFAVIKNEQNSDNQLKLYDEVIIEGKNIEEGKNVR
ncbi:MAG: hypothetical protein LBL34_05090 [Clostridiales bacterium]|nr:hypothetical protein [Clostridiales bacterium]